MNWRKLAAHVINWFVPSKYWRHVTRDFFLGDPIFQPIKHIKRYFFCRSCESHNHQPKFKYFLSICAIAKDEGPYIKEWLEFHRLVGVEKFYIYDNESTDDMKEVLLPYIESGVVEYTYWPGQRQQMAAYDDCLTKHGDDTQWLAYIDLDEFIVPLEGNDVRDVLKALPSDASELLMSWCVYGSGGHETKPEGLVTQSYKYRAEKVFAWVVKSIIKPRLCWFAKVYEHYVLGKAVTEDGTEVKMKFMDRDVIHPSKKIRVNHYHCKSWEEYQRRCLRGDALGGHYGDTPLSYFRERFKAHDLNEVYDPVMERWLPRLKAAIGEAK